MLTNEGKESVALLKEKLVGEAIDKARVRDLIEMLDDEDPKVRDMSAGELRYLDLEEEFREALKEASLEVQEAKAALARLGGKQFEMKRHM